MRKLLLALCLIPTLAWAQVPFQFPPPPSPKSIPVTASTSGTAATLTAIISGNTTTFDYLCGFLASSGGTTTASAVTISVTGITTPLYYVYEYPSSGQGLLGTAFPSCISAATKGQGITVKLGAGDSTSITALTAWGFAN